MKKVKEEHESFQKQETKRREDSILEQNNSSFTRGKGKSIGNLQKYRCQLCHENFETTTQAMCRHRDAHQNGDFIKIHQKVLKKGTVLLPHEHFYNHRSQQYIIQNDCTLHKIIPPEGAKIVEEKQELRCRRCDEFIAEWSENLSTQRKAGAIVKYDIHREHCECDVELDE